MKKSVVNNRYPSVRGQFDEASLEVCFDPVLKQKVLIFLLGVGRKPITCENALPRKKRSLLLERKVNNLEDIIVKRDTSNLGMSRKEVIQVISDIGQEKLFVQEENHLD